MTDLHDFRVQNCEEARSLVNLARQAQLLLGNIRDELLRGNEW